MFGIKFIIIYFVAARHSSISSLLVFNLSVFQPLERQKKLRMLRSKESILLSHGICPRKKMN